MAHIKKSRTKKQLMDEISTLTRKLEKLEEERQISQQLEMLANIIPVLLSSLRTMTLRDRLFLIALHAAQILASETCTVLIIKRDRFLRHEASYGYDLNSFPLGIEFEVKSGYKTGLTGHIAAGAKPFRGCGEELVNHPAVRGDKNSTTLRPCHSLLMVPLQEDSSGRIIGWIRADNKKEVADQTSSSVCFSETDIAIASIFANIVVTAIRTAQIVDELDMLTSVAPYGVIALDSRGFVAHANQLALKMLDYTSEQIVGIHVNDLYAIPNEAYSIKEQLKRSGSNRIENHETLVNKRDGSKVHIRLSVVMLLDSAGQPINSIGYFQDLSEINRVQAALHQERILLRTLIDNIPDYVYIKDLDGRFVEVNREAALRMGEEHPKALINRTDFEFYPSEFAQAYREIELSVIRTGKPTISYEEPVPDLTTSEVRTLLTTKVPWVDVETGEVKGIIGIGRDITKIRKVYVASEDLIRLDTPDEILETALHLVYETSGADWVTIVLFGTLASDQVLLNYPYRDNFKGSSIRQSGLSMEIRKTGIPIIVPNTAEFPADPGPNPVTIELGFRAFVGLPMAIKDKSIGVIWLHYIETQNFAEEMLRNVQFYIQQAAVAYDRLRRMKSDEQMRAAFAAAVEATAAGDYRTTLRAIMLGIRSVLSCDDIFLYAYNPDTNELHSNSITDGGPEENIVLDQGVSVDDGFVYDMLKEHDILVIPDTSQHEGFKQSTFAESRSIASCLVVPLRESGTSEVGVLFVSYRRRHVFTEQEITNIRLFAAQAAVALNNTRLHLLREKLFMNLAHEIHLPITGIMSDSEVLRDELAKTDLNRLHELASHNLGQVERAALITDTLLKTLGRDIPWQPVFTKHSLYRPLIEACRMFESEARANGCEIREPRSAGGEFPSILMSLQDLTIAFKNIIGNAVKYSYRSNNHYIRIEGSFDRTAPSLYAVSIQNYGVGITDEEIRTGKIFELYYRGKFATDRHRTGGGIGLAHAAHVIRKIHGGDIKVESKLQSGGAYLTTFRVLLPLT